MSETSVRAEAEKLFTLGGHLGHRKNRLHPKARKYVYTILNGTSIINLEYTVSQIEEAKKFLKSQAAEGKKLLVVSSKKSVAYDMAKLTSEAGVSAVTNKWLPGLLTNFEIIAKNIRKLKKMMEERTSGGWEKYVKHEQIALQKESAKLERLYGGILSLEKVPDVMFVVDIKKEKNAITEARMKNIPVVAIVDTNCDPNLVDYPIILNDDTPEAVLEVAKELITAYSKAVKVEAPVQAQA